MVSTAIAVRATSCGRVLSTIVILCVVLEAVGIGKSIVLVSRLVLATLSSLPLTLVKGEWTLVAAL